MTTINFQSVHKSYAARQAVIRDVNLDIAAGEFCVFLGPSGCGKSTLLRMVAGLESITSGDVHIGGVRMNEVPPARRHVAMVFQNYALYPHMSLYDNMAFGLRQARMPKAEIDQRVRAVAAILQITHMLDRLPKALSGGQRQRVAIGRALVRQPDVFLFDEPLSNLDAALRVHMRAEIARLHREFKRASAVYVTHDQTEAMALADKIVLLRAGEDMVRHGSIAQVGSPMDLYHRPRDLFVAGFLGSPRMNFLPASVDASAADEGLVVVCDRTQDGDGAGGRIHLGSGFAPLAQGTRVTVGIRPEHLQPGAVATAPSLERPVRQVEHFGEYSYVYLEGSGGAELIAKVSGHSPSCPGDTAAFSFQPTSAHLFDASGFALARLDA